ncbi:peptidylprolyl isomerase [Collinsella tanakaei]|uniref:FKBP-type peptidyl-prolyl cis-trans isomerase n=1 Tax=Collinsella ihumii TaxID=1720204 RepID=UPI00083628A4|nr:peptidylprolyl isomerase [Collinsella ihumii]MBM6784702.1 peptidylprolyl isomerase [Collinsella tanakaei]MBM6906340.1 peptidylprolyl isomerase [Collinsella tanakaei]MCF6413902.1 peptidylprolyl isomerase [Collinsella tanakaei]MDN0055288.1 peptidylprolyl isomerase [Collinsella ihumii]
MSNDGKKVRAHYRGTLDDGTQFDSSYDRGEPIEFTCGAHQMIAGFDAAVMDMEVGEKKTVHIPADQAYGQHRKELVFRIPADQVPNIDQVHAGDHVYLSGPAGQPIPAVVLEVNDEGVMLDANHEMAGKDLNFEIELVEVLD